MPKDVELRVPFLCWVGEGIPVHSSSYFLLGKYSRYLLPVEVSKESLMVYGVWAVMVWE